MTRPSLGAYPCLCLALALALTPLANAAPAAATGCDRAALLAAADKYVEAQTAGSLDPLQDILSANFSYVENNAAADVSSGVLSHALVIDHRRSTADTTDCATYTELISTGGKAPGAGAAKPYVIGTQLRHDPTTLSIVLIDSVASTTGSWSFDAAKTLSHVLSEDWPAIPADRQDDRAVLRRAADAYLDIWSNATAADAVPWGTPCARLEGSAYTGRGRADDSCKGGLPTNHNQAPNTRRRYVIDEEAGSCDVLCVWEHMMMAADSHEFRLEGGKLRYVHTITVCPGQTCRL